MFYAPGYVMILSVDPVSSYCWTRDKDDCVGGGAEVDTMGGGGGVVAWACCGLQKLPRKGIVCLVSAA